MDVPPGLRNPKDLFFQQDGVRRAIIAAYWTVIILAIPLWWHTTSIERLPLPDARVSQQVDRPVSIPVQICIEGASDGLASRVQSGVRGNVPARWKGLEVEVVGGRCDATKEDVYTVINTSQRIISGRRLEYQFDEAHIDDLVQTLTALIAPIDEERSRHNRVVQFSSRYRLAFSLLNEDASAGNSVMAWDVRKGIQEHIQPVLDVLNRLHNFTIESQVQYYAPLAFEVRATEDGTYGLSYEDLTVFVNSAEWTLSSSASNDPVLHFLLFIPSASHTPLKILSKDGTPSKSNAFLLPQWGGISIYNTPKPVSLARLPNSALSRTFATFSTQLLTLLGIPELPEGVKSEERISQWQLDALTRRRVLETAKETQDTLRSFIKLANSIENMPVHADVRDDIEGSLDALEKLYATASSSLSQAFTYSAEAYNLASRAFFNPGMLALLYFPAEHKYAVYAPLFASAVIPLIVAALREFMAWKRQRTQVQVQQ